MIFVMAVVEGGKGYVLCVKDWEHARANRRTAYWKLPGGKHRLHETPIETALRKLEDETGLKLEEKDLALVEILQSKTHSRLLYRAYVPYEMLRERRTHGATKLQIEVDVFDFDQIFAPRFFLPAHAHALWPHIKGAPSPRSKRKENR